MRIRSMRVLGISILGGALAVSGAQLGAQAAQPGSVVVPITTINASVQGGLNGAVEIRLGDSDPFLVMLDTGSVGLRLFPSAPKRGVGDTPGTGRAVIGIGRTQTTQTVAVEYLSSSNSWIAGWERQGVLGILGIGLKESAIPNPLRFLPQAQGQSWSVKFERSGRGALVLGAASPADAIMHFSLPPDGAGNRYWNDHAATGCWTFTAPRNLPVEGVRHCVDTWFDSGFPIMRIKGRQFDRLALTPDQSLRPGTEVRVAPSGNAFAPVVMRAGNQGSRNTTRVVASGRALINTGNAMFFDYRFTYNAATGDIYLESPATDASDRSVTQ
jgi:hypothetical protein